jgi:hypothetical protein
MPQLRLLITLTEAIEVSGAGECLASEEMTRIQDEVTASDQEVRTTYRGDEGLRASHRQATTDWRPFFRRCSCTRRSR